MFTAISSCCTQEKGDVFCENVTSGQKAAHITDFIAGIALLIIGILSAQTIIHVSPAAAYAMIALGGFQIYPFVSTLLISFFKCVHDNADCCAGYECGDWRPAPVNFTYDPSANAQ